MKPQTIGRALGIGVRVAGRIAGQTIAASAQTAASATASQPTASPRAGGQAAGRVAGGITRGLSRGVGGFFSPFRRVGGILWLEITGSFFLLPVILFAPTLWRTRMSYAHGPDHRLFLITAAVMALFLYLSVSSFWRARKR
jgi:hypothetical protein